MCGCRAHYSSDVLCSCDCPEHDQYAKTAAACSRWNRRLIEGIPSPAPLDAGRVDYQQRAAEVAASALPDALMPVGVGFRHFGTDELTGYGEMMRDALAPGIAAALEQAAADAEQRIVQRMTKLADDLEARGRRRMADSRRPDTVLTKQLRTGALARLADVQLMRAALAEVTTTPQEGR